MNTLNEWKALATIDPVVREYDYKYVEFFCHFAIHSDVLGGWIIFPIRFVCDRESTPFVKGTSIRGGYAHDLLCRKDANRFIIMDNGGPIPLITKKLAAQVYLEIMSNRYGLKLESYSGIMKQVKRLDLFVRRYGKYSVVRVWPGYFDKFKVLATYEEITG
jgi:hypothetical protein